METPSTALENATRELFLANKEKTFNREEILSNAIISTNRKDINLNMLSGVMHRLKTQGFVVNIERGKYCYNQKFNIEDVNENYILSKSKSILDKVILEFENEISKIDAMKVETNEDIKNMQYLKQALKDLKESRAKI